MFHPVDVQAGEGGKHLVRVENSENLRLSGIPTHQWSLQTEWCLRSQNPSRQSRGPLYKISGPIGWSMILRLEQNSAFAQIVIPDIIN